MGKRDADEQNSFASFLNPSPYARSERKALDHFSLFFTASRPSRSSSCFRYKLLGSTCWPNDSQYPSSRGPNAPFVFVPTNPIAQFCAVGGRWQTSSPSQFHAT